MGQDPARAELCPQQASKGPALWTGREGFKRKAGRARAGDQVEGTGRRGKRSGGTRAPAGL